MLLGLAKNSKNIEVERRLSFEPAELVSLIKNFYAKSEVEIHPTNAYFLHSRIKKKITFSTFLTDMELFNHLHA